MAKPNYSFEKRRKEQDRKKKQQEKLQRKKEKSADGQELVLTDGDKEQVE